MGRLDPNAVQYEFHQTHEDEAPMDDDEEIWQDLYEPSNSSNNNNNNTHVDDDYILNDEKPQPPPPPPQVLPQAFPPTQELVDDPLPFPPASHDDHQMNFHHHHHHHHQQQQPRPVQPQPNSNNNIINGMQQFQHHSAFGQPVHEMPYGTSPSPPLIPQLLLNQPWKTHLFDCMGDPENAIITFLFPCLTFGQIAEILDSGNTTCAGSGIRYGLIGCCLLMPCIMSSTYRTKMRGRFRLIESPAPDWLVHCFCECCALCQEYRELQERDIDPSIGWLGNVAKQQRQQFGTTAPMQQRMI